MAALERRRRRKQLEGEVEGKRNRRAQTEANQGSGRPRTAASWYRLAFEASPTPSFELRPDFSVHRLNAAGRELFNRFGAEEFEALLEQPAREEFRAKAEGLFKGALGEFRMECALRRFGKPPVPHLIDVTRVDLTENGWSALVFLLDQSEQKRVKKCWDRVERIAGVGSWDWEVDSGKIDWSIQVYELFGLSRDEFDGQYQTFLEYVHPEDRAAVEVAVREAFYRNKPFDLDYRVRCPKGGVLYVHDSAEIERDTEGRPTRMHGAILDITERKQAEEALRRSELMFRLLFETAPLGLWLLDSDGKIVRANPAGRRIWGGARNVGPEHYDQYEAWFLDSGKRLSNEDWAAFRAMKKGERIVGERLRIRRFDGPDRIIENSAIPIQDENGVTIGGLVTNRDITEQVKAGRALADNERRFRQIFLIPRP